MPRCLQSETQRTYTAMRLGERLSKSAEAVSDEINIFSFAISFLKISNELSYPDPVGDSFLNAVQVTSVSAVKGGWSACWL